MQSPLAELRGGSFLFGYRGEASLYCGSRVQPRPVKVMRIVTLYWVLPAEPKAKISTLINGSFAERQVLKKEEAGRRKL